MGVRVSWYWDRTVRQQTRLIHRRLLRRLGQQISFVHWYSLCPAIGVTAITGKFYRPVRIVAVVAAIFTTLLRRTGAGGMGAFRFIVCRHRHINAPCAPML